MLVILNKILPLYLVVIAGYVAAKKLGVRKDEMARLVIYILTPVVVFDGIAKAPLQANYFALPIIFFSVCLFFCFFTLHLSRRLGFQGTEPNILAFASANANSGYFAIPVGAALFGADAMTAIILCSFGFVLFENTFGFYIVARGNSSARESFHRVLRLPAVYAFLFGLLANIAGWKAAQPVQELFVNVRGGYSVLGMMLIGMAISDAGKLALDLRFSAAALVMKFVAWPLVFSLILFSAGNFFDPSLAKIVFFMSTLPLAANTVAFAALLDAHPEKAAGAVLASTLLALAVIPLLNG